MEKFESFVLALKMHLSVYLPMKNVPLYVFNYDVKYPPLIWHNILNYILNIINIFSTFTFIGLILLILLGLIKKRGKVQEKFFPTRIVAVIPAHNEEDSIALVINSAVNAGFDKVYLIGDACTDNTVNIAKELGVEVIEVNARSKSKALNWALPQIIEKEGVNAFFMFFDAGNVFDKDFLKKALPYIKAYPIIQFRTRNANYTHWVSRMFVIMSAFFFKIQIALNNLGLSAILSGFGWGAYGWVLKEFPYEVKSITDDFEYTVRVKYNVQYVDCISVYDEKPESFIVSFKQRLRWTRGYFYLLFTDIKSFRNKPYLILLPLSFVLWLISIFVLILDWNILTVVSSFAINSIMFFVTLDKIDFKMIKFYDIFTFFFFNATNIIVILIALFTFFNTKWFRTPHTGKVEKGLHNLNI